MTTTTRQYAIILPIINDGMTCAEIAAAWLPVIDQVETAMIESLFDLEMCDLYDFAVAMYAQDYTTGSDYKAPVATDSELPF